MADWFIGLMSGTSADGIDAALIRIQGERVAFIAGEHTPLPDDLRNMILSTNAGALSLGEFAALDHDLGEEFAAAANHIVRVNELRAEDIKAIGSHGQTVWHAATIPQPNSLQIGDPNLIAERTGICTVADFRRRDMAAGGQGAPLVPAFHELLFRKAGIDRGVLNIGGIANLTVLPAVVETPVTGFDTGPGNALCDEWAKLKLGQAFDPNGQLAASGAPIQDLLTGWLDDAYFSKPAPKSTGRDYFRLARMVDVANLERHPAKDIQATLLELSAQSIAHAVRRVYPKLEELLLCGGGINNDCLMRRLEQLLPQVSLQTTDTLGIPGDYLEAMAFAWLACCRLTGRAAGLKSVTGARHECVLGAVYPGA